MELDGGVGERTRNNSERFCPGVDMGLLVEKISLEAALYRLFDICKWIYYGCYSEFRKNIALNFKLAWLGKSLIFHDSRGPSKNGFGSKLSATKFR